VHCTLMYAPPEVVVAFAAKSRIAAEPSHDVWALGVMVVEALTGRSAISRYSSQEDVIALAKGERLYPWEEMVATGGSVATGANGVGEVGDGKPADEAEGAQAYLRSRARPALEACLRRDAAARPAASELLRMIDNLGAVHTVAP
jgi:serine/threonine protein kinase